MGKQQGQCVKLAVQAIHGHKTSKTAINQLSSMSSTSLSSVASINQPLNIAEQLDRQ